MENVILVIQLIVLTFLLYVIFLLSYSLVKGAPYAGLSKKRIKIMMELLNMQHGNFIDVGSGDGRIVIAAAKRGANSYGIEINPLLYFISKRKIHKAKFTNAHIILADFWKHTFSNYDYVALWGTNHMTKRLEKKLRSELKPGAKVVSNHYQFPNWKPKKVVDNVYLYVA
jgi:precorrin-6B methylase 2